MSKYFARLYATVHLDRVIEVEANSREEAIEKINYLGYGSLPIDDDIIDINNWRRDTIDPSDIKINRVREKKEE